MKFNLLKKSLASCAVLCSLGAAGNSALANSADYYQNEYIYPSSGYYEYNVQDLETAIPVGYYYQDGYWVYIFKKEKSAEPVQFESDAYDLNNDNTKPNKWLKAASSYPIYFD